MDFGARNKRATRLDDEMKNAFFDFRVMKRTGWSRMTHRHIVTVPMESNRHLSASLDDCDKN